MQALTVIAVALVASASAYQPMRTTYDNVESCVCKGAYNKVDKHYGLTVAPCDSTEHTFVDLAFPTQGGYLQTEDKWCLSPASADPKAPIVLTKCQPATCKGWELYQGNQWSTVHVDLCMGTDAKTGALIQVPCAEAPAFELGGCKVAPVPAAPVAPAPVAPVAPALTCANFVNSCPAGYYVPSNYYGLPATAQTCVNTCCVPVPRTCGSFAAEYGCGKYGELNPYTVNKPCTTDRDCLYNCCEEKKPATCADFRCPYGFELIVDPALSVCAYGACKVEECCTKVVPVEKQTCGEWSAANGGNLKACGVNFLFMGNDNLCLKDGSNCQANCCMQLTGVNKPSDY